MIFFRLGRQVTDQKMVFDRSSTSLTVAFALQKYEHGLQL
jgi:hypothetical protein